MSSSNALAVTPDQRPVELVQYRNSWGWSPRIWDSLLTLHHPEATFWVMDDSGLLKLWDQIEDLPDWQQIPLVLTFDTGVIPWQRYGEAAELLDEFDRRCPAKPGVANHVPAVAQLLSFGPECPLFGMWGTTVSSNPFDPWDDDADEPGSGIPLAEMFALPQHRELIRMGVDR